MTRTAIFLLFFSFISNSSFAQFRLAAIAGVNVSSSELNRDDIFSADQYPFMHLGASAQFDIIEKLRIGVDAQFSNKGYRINDIAQDGVLINRYSYLDFLPFLEWRLTNNFGIGGGVNLAKALQAKSILNGDATDVGLDTINALDFGLAAHARVNFSKLFLQIRYNLGLSTVSEVTITDEVGNPVGNLSEMNRNIQLTLGYYLID